MYVIVYWSDLKAIRGTFDHYKIGLLVGFRGVLYDAPRVDENNPSFATSGWRFFWARRTIRP